jgi:predicted amidophosphoribosyltransferase
VLRLKFGGASASAEALGGLLAQCAAELLSGEFDTVTWVPVGRRRLRARGYDQARLLAEAACRLWDTKPLPLLNKPRDNPAQSGLTGPAARRANVLGVYQAEPALTRGRRILVIDDVVTTGATLGECAGELFRAGAAAVACAALTRTPDESAEKPACRTEP